MVHKNILIATDGSKLSNKGLEYGLNLAAALQASVVIVTVSEPLSFFVELPDPQLRSIYKKRYAEVAKKILQKAEKKAQNRALFCVTKHVSEQVPVVGIIETAKKHRCDLIVMASHGRTGLAKLFLGSQALAVLAHSKIPVLIVR